MFEAYKIGVTLSLTNHVSKGLMLMAGDFAKTEAQATLLQKRIHSIKNDAIKGGLFLGAGVGMLALLKGPYEEAKKLAQAQANFQTLNLSAFENSQAFGKAASMSHKILGTTITENVKQIHDLHTAFGDLHHAIGTADIFAKMSIVAKVANGGTSVDGIVNAAAKALEHRGGKVINNPAEFAAESDLMTKVMLATKMRVSPKDYMTASGTGKMAYQLMDKEYLYGNFAGLMSINGGAREGTQAMTAFSSLIGGHMDSKGKGFLSDLGIYQEGFSKKRLGLMHSAMMGMSPEQRKIAIASMGGQAVLSGGLSDANAEMYAHRPDIFISTVLVPAIKKRFGMDLSDEQMALLVAKNFNRSTGDFIGTQITMASKLAKDTSIINKSMGNESAYQHYLKSPEGAEEAAGAAWKNFLAMFGSVYLPKITSGLLKLASGLDSLATWVDKNQGLVKGLVYAFAALAGGLALRGTVLLLSATMRGLGIAFMFSKAGGIAGVSRLGTLLIGTATGLGALTSAAGLFMAAYAGWKIGEALGNKIDGSVQKSSGYGVSSMRDWLAQSRFGKATGMFNFGQDEALHFVNAPSQKPVQVTTLVHLDGRAIGEVVTVHQARAASKPQSGVGRFDVTQMPLGSGMAFR